MTGTLQVIGVYRITPTYESILEAVRYHECHWLIDQDGKYTDQIYWDNCENLALVEVQIQGRFSPDDWLLVSQNDQAPYMEFYLDDTGTQPLSEKDALGACFCRACFFLHFVDTTRSLKFGEDKLSLPPMSALPERLRPFTHYLPVD
jgi:hypothetical protein